MRLHPYKRNLDSSNLPQVLFQRVMHFKAVLIGLAIFGFMVSETMATAAEASPDARAEAGELERTRKDLRRRRVVLAELA
ncbi:hypothetical protein V5799_014732 [Amblyomma americanum]|uniref:Uncharacterized protein n=1 Tax=Amblyomma americanum TaxID=6943 RepID=A0AAQ4E262_AMBAM